MGAAFVEWMRRGDIHETGAILMRTEQVGVTPVRNRPVIWPIFLLVLLFGSGLQALADDDPDLTAAAARIERGLTSSNTCYGGIDRVINDFEMWQRFMAIIAPPSTNAYVYAKRGELHTFAPSGFPPGFVAGLVPETYRDSVTVYRITVGEDPITRDRVIFNADGLEIWSQPAPAGYDPFAFVRIVYPWALEQNSERALQLLAQHDPSRVRSEYLLLPLESAPTYAMFLATASAQRALTLSANQSTMMMNMNDPDPDAFVFTSITVTGGVTDVGIHLPDGVSCRVDLFYTLALPGFPWSLATTTPTMSGTFDIQMDSSLLTNAFFRAGNADIDSDGDGIPDDRELLMYGTNPYLADSDGDGLSDYDEMFVYHTNPLLRDSDGDGTDDDEQVRAGTNHVASVSSIRFYYDGDDRLAGAYGGAGSGGGASTYLNSPAGNTSTAAERNAP